jgi:hypothetical protein
VGCAILGIPDRTRGRIGGVVALAEPARRGHSLRPARRRAAPAAQQPSTDEHRQLLLI